MSPAWLAAQTPAAASASSAAAPAAQPLPTSAQQLQRAAAQPTPRTRQGHPDLTGYWSTTTPMFGFEGKPFIDQNGSARPLFGDNGQESRNAAGYYAGRANYDKNSAGRPLYKPQYREQAKANFMQLEKRDPLYRCQAQGVPRLGVPNEIFQSSSAVALLYENPFDTSDHYTYRVVPIDGRGHDPKADEMPMGDPVGHWEGDTLVIDVTHLSPDTWIDRNGSFHDAQLHVTERLTRKGNTLVYAMTADDPSLFEQPFSPPALTWVFKAGEHAHEDYPCSEHDQEHVTYEEGK